MKKGKFYILFLITCLCLGGIFPFPYQILQVKAANPSEYASLEKNFAGDADWGKLRLSDESDDHGEPLLYAWVNSGAAGTAKNTEAWIYGSGTPSAVYFQGDPEHPEAPCLPKSTLKRIYSGTGLSMTIQDGSSLCKRFSAVKIIDTTGWSTENASDFSEMFSGCSYLTKLDLRGFRTGHVTDMSGMFDGCFSLSELVVSSFDTSSVRDMSRMFRGTGLTSLDLSSFNTSALLDAKEMFKDCYYLSTLILGGI